MEPHKTNLESPLPDLILASNSPRRRQLLALGGWTFRVRAVEIEEQPAPGESPESYVRRLAVEKACAVAALEAFPALVVAADTTVADGRVILGKPRDDAEAAAMLRRLRGRTHLVYTAIAALTSRSEAPWTELCTTEVPMRNYNDGELQAYVQSGDPLDKAGAYAIQHSGFHPVDSLEGCYANVVGLPLCHLTRLLRRLGILPHKDVPAACQSTLQYVCPVYRQILSAG